MVVMSLPLSMSMMESWVQSLAGVACPGFRRFCPCQRYCDGRGVLLPQLNLLLFLLEDANLPIFLCKGYRQRLYLVIQLSALPLVG
jgi:hypothetical protein